MPRNGRGGRRSGRPGAAYAQRSDLNAKPRLAEQRPQPVRVARGGTYGTRQQSEAAQRAVPLPEVVPLDAPTARPDEPLTAGLPSGPGPGPEALGMVGPGNPKLSKLKAMFAADPDEDLGWLIAQMEDETF